MEEWCDSYPKRLDTRGVYRTFDAVSRRASLTHPESPGVTRQ